VELRQPRFFDPASRIAEEYNEKIWYIHLTPIKAGLALCPQEDFANSPRRAICLTRSIILLDTDVRRKTRV